MSAKGYQYAIVHLGGKEHFKSRQFYPKYNLPFLLLSDPERQAIEAYGV